MCTQHTYTFRVVHHIRSLLFHLFIFYSVFRLLLPLSLCVSFARKRAFSIHFTRNVCWVFFYGPESYARCVYKYPLRHKKAKNKIVERMDERAIAASRVTTKITRGICVGVRGGGCWFVTGGKENFNHPQPLPELRVMGNQRMTKNIQRKKRMYFCLFSSFWFSKL